VSGQGGDPPPPRRSSTEDRTAEPAVSTPELPEVSTLVLLLPSTGSRPVASPQLGAARAGRGTLRLLPWLVPVLRLAPDTDPASIADRLAKDDRVTDGAALADGAGLLEGAALLDGGRCGSSVPYLVQVRSFAADLVGRGRVLPGLLTGADGAQARWLPILSGVDTARLTSLCRAMPPVCRAEPGPAVPGAAQVLNGAGEVLDHALRSMVDGLVRRRLRVARTHLVPRGERAASTAAGGWLAALTGTPRFDAEPTALRELADRLDAWHASGGRDAPVRTCLRLSHVDERLDDGVDRPDGLDRADDTVDGERWLLEFLMQPLDDPSVLITAYDVWHDAGSPLYRWVEYPQEQLLSDLGRASRLYPDLDPALRSARPHEMVLDTAGAYRFLTHAALLAEAGFGVLLPARWQRPMELGLSLTVHSGPSTTAVLRDNTVDLTSIVDYEWGIALGGEELSHAELARLARVKVPLVRLRGRWTYLDRDRLAAGLAFLSRGGSGTISAGEALRRVWLRTETTLPLPVTAAGGDGWLGDLLAGRSEEILEPVEPPVGLTATLRPYQRRGLSWLVFLDRLGLGALLADDMGLGKTVQLLALEVAARAAAKRPPTLVVCPLSVLGNWQREAERFAPGLSVHVHHGADRDLAVLAADHDLILTTYALASRDVDTLVTLPWDRIVLDEAQHVKNSGSAVARAVRRIPARHRVALTGTPVENRLAELWSIMDFLNPGILASAATFRARYAVPVERYADTDAAARLRRVTRPFLLRRLKTDPAVIDDLPDKLALTQLCTLTVEQATLYRAVVDDLFARLRESTGIRRKGLVLAAMSKLKQACNHPAHLLGDGSPLAGRSGKLARLEEILERVVADGDKALCFTQFAKFGAMLQPYLTARLGTPVVFLHGGTPRGARDAMVERFQADAGPGVFVLSLKAGGTGINLTAARHVIHVDRWWNPATEAQATDRAYRLGQGCDVRVHTFVCIGTLEEKIDRMLADKAAMARLVVGGGESWLGTLSTGELREIVTLSAAAVGE
jgi:hypothetical protein